MSDGRGGAGLVVDGNRFFFTDGTETLIYDECSFYRRKLQGSANARGVDVVVVQSSQDTTFFIEAKDYTRHGSEQPALSDLADTVIRKFLDTLAGLELISRGTTGDQAFAVQALTQRRLRLCVAVEFPDRGDRLNPPKKTLADFKALLTRRTRFLELKPIVTANHHPVASVPWTSQRDTETY
ncbi:hypothetical protein [Corynebacterium variabile]|uniref:hypothetical protein n=1 Tax=Corynebacterium variabile TaxID=1727 RepID=UPI003BAE7CDD